MEIESKHVTQEDVEKLHAKWNSQANRERFEQRCWELYCSMAGNEQDAPWPVLFKAAVQGVDEFERKMKELEK